MAKIRNLGELRAWYGESAKGLSDEDLMADFASITRRNPTEIANTFGYDPGSGSLTGERLSSGADSYQANLYGVGEALAGAVGLRGVENWAARNRRANEFQSNVATDRARALGGIESMDEIQSLGDVPNWTGGLLARSLPYMGEAAVGGLAGRALSGLAGMSPTADG